MLFWIKARWEGSSSRRCDGEGSPKTCGGKTDRNVRFDGQPVSGLIRAILRASAEWEWIDRFPPIKLYRLSNRRLRWLTREEAGNLIGHLPEDLKSVALFSLATGLRRFKILLAWNGSRSTSFVRSPGSMGSNRNPGRRSGFP